MPKVIISRVGWSTQADAPGADRYLATDPELVAALAVGDYDLADFIVGVKLDDESIPSAYFCHVAHVDSDRPFTIACDSEGAERIQYLDQLTTYTL